MWRLAAIGFYWCSFAFLIRCGIFGCIESKQTINWEEWPLTYRKPNASNKQTFWWRYKSSTSCCTLNFQFCWYQTCRLVSRCSCIPWIIIGINCVDNWKLQYNHYGSTLVALSLLGKHWAKMVIALQMFKSLNYQSYLSIICLAIRNKNVSVFVSVSMCLYVCAVSVCISLCLSVCGSRPPFPPWVCHWKELTSHKT